MKNKIKRFLTMSLLLVGGLLFVHPSGVNALSPGIVHDAPLSRLRVVRRTSHSLTVVWNSPIRTGIATTLALSPAAKVNPRTHRITVIDDENGTTVQRFATSQGMVTIRNLKPDHSYRLRVRGGYEPKGAPALVKRLTTPRRAR